MPGPNLRPAVLAARDRLRKGREKLKTLHASGAPGIQVSTYLTDLVDAICLDLYQSAWADLGGRDREAHLALVAHGGYGRRDVAPFSDVDLMMLLEPGTESQVRPLAQRLTQDICDAGLMLGFSLRTPAEGADTVIWLAASPSARGRSGLFWFDRAPRSTHLLPWTRESAVERRALRALCDRAVGARPAGSDAGTGRLKPRRRAASRR